MACRKSWMLAVILMNMLLLAAGTSELSFAAQKESISFSSARGKPVPRAVAEWVKACRRLDLEASAFTKGSGRHTYFFVSSGVRPTGGYNVRVSSVERTGARTLGVHVRFAGPGKQARVIRQRTRPYDLVVFPDTGWTVAVVPEGDAKPFRVAGLAGIQELQTIVSESRAIKLFAPAPGSTIGRMFSVRGVALVFEGTVQMRLVDGRGKVVEKTFTTAATAAEWGYFSKRFAVPESLPSGTLLRLELYTVDEEKGGKTNLVRVALRLH